MAEVKVQQLELEEYLVRKEFRQWNNLYYIYKDELQKPIPESVEVMRKRLQNRLEDLMQELEHLKGGNNGEV